MPREIPRGFPDVRGLFSRVRSLAFPSTLAFLGVFCMSNSDPEFEGIAPDGFLSGGIPVPGSLAGRARAVLRVAAYPLLLAATVVVVAPR
ncbi:hypothetical protein ACFQVA_37655 [Actinomadura keratinilytica]